MAVLEVRELRRPSLNTIEGSGERSFRVTLDQYTNYGAMMLEATTAIDPNDSNRKIPEKGQSFYTGLPPTQFGTPIVSEIYGELYSEQNKQWDVTVSYSALDDDGGGQNGGFEYPWNEPPVDDWGSTIVQRPMLVDVNNKPMVNSIGERFAEVLTRPVALRRLVVTENRKYGSFSPMAASKFISTINSASFSVGGQTIPQEKALCTGYNGRTAYVRDPNGNQTKYWQVTASWDIITDDDDWHGYILDQGYNQFDENGAPDTILIKGAVTPSAPQLLNGNGKRLINVDGSKNAAKSGAYLPIDTRRSASDRVFLRYEQFKKTSHGSII